jgi:hypothetical protein
MHDPCPAAYPVPGGCRPGRPVSEPVRATRRTGVAKSFASSGDRCERLVQQSDGGFAPHRGVPSRVTRFLRFLGETRRTARRPAQSQRVQDPPILRENNVGAVSRSRKHRGRLFIHGEDRFPTNYPQGFHSPRLSGSTPGLPKIERKREDNIITGSPGRTRAVRSTSSVASPVRSGSRPAAGESASFAAALSSIHRPLNGGRR